jgi:hypothetical protein
MIHCFNEDCMASEARRQQFFLRLFGTSKPPKNVPVKRGKRDSSQLKEIDWPGKVVPLHELPRDHPANDYLRSRGFDPYQLSKEYGLRYCSQASQGFGLASERIIVPIFMNKKMVGWQARFVGERDWKNCPVPKYWDRPGMPKRLMLYNFDVATQQSFGVLQEGVTDVWSTGKNAMGLLGKSISSAQRQLLAFSFHRKPLLVMLDGDAQVDNECIVHEMKASNRVGVGIIVLPDEKDPGDFEPEANMSFIRAAAKAQGINLE